MSAFATPAFLAFAAPGLDARVVALPGGRRLPLLHLERETPLFAGPRRFGVTPICLCGPSSFGPDDLAVLAVDGLAGGFVQSRDPRGGESGFYARDGVCAFLDGRTNYRLPLGLDDDALLARMKRDSRGRVRKLLDERSRFRMVEGTGDRAAIARFAALYAQTAARAGFSPAYQFDEARLQGLLAAPPWRLFLLEHDGAVVAGAVVAEVDGGFDYTFMAYGEGPADVSRANVLFTYWHLGRDHQGSFDLGGGIAEDDALARFKLGMGGEPVRFRRVRFAFVDTDDPAQVARCQDALTARFP